MAKKRLIQVIMAAASLLLCADAWGISNDDVLFYAPFEDNYDAQIAAGSPGATVTGKVPFTGGRQGKGILIGGGRLDYETAGNLDLKCGTVALSIMPVNWDKDTYTRDFFAVVGRHPGCYMSLYKYVNQLYFLVQQSYDKRQYIHGGRHHDYKRGRWTHATVTWNGNNLKIYIDGEFVNDIWVPTNFFVKELGARFNIGSNRQRPDTVLDEFYIFRRALSPEEIKLLCTEGHSALGKTVEVKQPRLTAFQYLAGMDALRISGWVPLRRIDDKRKLRASAAVLKSTGVKTSMPPTEADFTGNRFQLNVRTADLPAGPYTVAVSLLVNKKRLGAVERPFTKPRPPRWLGNKLGITDEVPEPWTPLVREENKLSMWGRRYAWEKSLFPSSIITQGKEILARPIQLKANALGSTVEASLGKMQWNEVNPGRMQLEGAGKLGPLSVRASWSIEYDGFAWCKLRVEGAAINKINSLKLEVPLRPEMATLEMMNLGGDHLARSGKVRPLSLNITGAPVIWLGNEVGGLQWTAETDRTWQMKNQNRKIEVIPGGKEVLLRINFADSPVRGRVFEAEFGLHATPVKPMPADFRERYTLDSFYVPQWTPTPEQQFTQVLRKDWKKTFANMGKIFPYHNLTLMWSGTPELKYFGAEWTAGAGGFNGAVCRGADSLIEYWLWKWKEILDNNPDFARRISGIYMDTCQPAYCVNTLHGCAVRNRQGELRGKYPLLAAREYQKRLYVLMQKEHPEYRLVQHQSSAIHMQQLSFIHQLVSGENSGHAGGAAIRRDCSYYNVPWFTFEGLQSEFMGWNLGFFPIFLPQPFRIIGGTKGDPEKAVKILGPEGIPASEHVIGMLLAHDILIWGSYMNLLPFDRVAAVKKKFGWDRQVEFLPYWNNDEYVTLATSAEPVKCSLFKRPGKVLAVIVNNSSADAEVTLKLNLAALGIIEPAEALDAYQAVTVQSMVWDVAKLRERQEISGKKKFPGKIVKLPVKKGVIEVEVKARNFRTLEIRNHSDQLKDDGSD